MSLQLLPATVANADIRSLKSLHTFLQKCLYHMLVKFEQNRMVKTTRNVELFDKKQVFENHFWQSANAILEGVSVTEAETIV